MSTDIQLTIGGTDTYGNVQFVELLKAWIRSRGDYTIILGGPGDRASYISYAIKDGAPKLHVAFEADLRDEAAEMLRHAEAGPDLTPKHYEMLGRAVTGLMRQGTAKVEEAAEPVKAKDGGLLRRIQKHLPETKISNPIGGRREFRGGRQMQMLLAGIYNMVMPADPDAGSFATEASRKLVDIEALKPSDIGRLAYLVMQLARHLPAGEVDFVDAIIEASKTEKPV